MSTPLHVLFVEDSENDVVLIARELRRGGYDPTWERVDTAAAMTAALARHPWDLVIADYSLPQFSSLAALRLLQEGGLDLPFIIVSGSIPDEVAVELMRAGAHDYLLKDNLSRLIVAVARELRDAQIRRDLLKAQEALRGQRDFAESLIETAQMIVLVLDTEGRIVRFNPYMEEITGYRLEEVEGRDWFSIFMPAADRDRGAGLFRQTVRDLHVRGHVNTIITRDGTERHIEWYAKTLQDAHGNVIGVLSVGQDITARTSDEARLRELEEVARHRQRLADIGAITAQIVHDIGNPLAGISMQAQLILRRAEREAHQPIGTVRQQAERILTEARRLDCLIKEFMEFAREQRLDPTPVQLPRFLAEVVTLWQPVASARAIALTLDLPGVLPTLRADENQLRRVFENLLKNAVEAIDRGPGHIHIRATVPHAERVCICVEDTGPGIPEGVHPFRLFETTKPQGTGLGLPIVQQIVLAHHGRIDFTRREPHGTVFTVELPLHAHET